MQKQECSSTRDQSPIKRKYDEEHDTQDQTPIKRKCEYLDVNIHKNMSEKRNGNFIIHDKLCTCCKRMTNKISEYTSTVTRESKVSPFLPDRDTLTRGREDTMGRSTTTINTSTDEITVLACETLASSDISDESYSCGQGRRRVRVRKKHFQRFGLWFLSKLFL